MIKQILASLKNMLKNKSGKVAVSYFFPSFELITSRKIETRCIDNFISSYSNEKHERIVVPKDWGYDKAMLELAKKESKEEGIIGKIRFHFFKNNWEKYHKTN